LPGKHSTSRLRLVRLLSIARLSSASWSLSAAVARLSALARLSGAGRPLPVGRLPAVGRLLPGGGAILRGAWVAMAVLLATAMIVWSMVWVRSVSGAGPGPVLVEPAALTPAASALTTPPATSAPVTSSPPVRRTTRPALPVPNKSRVTTKPAPPSRTARPAQAALTATYAVGTSWDTGFIGAVRVRNMSAVPQNWAVAVRWDGAAGVRITQAWNASLSSRGDVTVLSGGPLAPGATQNLGFEATKQLTGPVRPASCTVNGSWCRMS
jgi:cellulase/cellobiase CelA1